jgi:hypothetical protein
MALNRTAALADPTLFPSTHQPMATPATTGANEITAAQPLVTRAAVSTETGRSLPRFEGESALGRTSTVSRCVAIWVLESIAVHLSEVARHFTLTDEHSADTSSD